MAGPIRTGILHVPQIDEDAGSSVAQILQQSIAGIIILREQSVVSQCNMLEERLRNWCDEDELDLIFTVGATYPAPGPSAAELAPEATLGVIERVVPGLAETMRFVAGEETPYAFLDRGVAGIRGRTLIVNLPAGESAAMLFLNSIIDLLEPTLLHLGGSLDAPTIEEALNEAETEPMDEGAWTLKADEFRAFLSRDEDSSEDGAHR